MALLETKKVLVILSNEFLNLYSSFYCVLLGYTFSNLIFRIMTLMSGSSYPRDKVLTIVIVEFD